MPCNERAGCIGGACGGSRYTQGRTLWEKKCMRCDRPSGCVEGDCYLTWRSRIEEPSGTSIKHQIIRLKIVFLQSMSSCGGDWTRRGKGTVPIDEML